MSVLLGEIMKALHHDPTAYDKLAGVDGADAEIIDLDDGAGTDKKADDDILSQLKQASEEIVEISNAIASDEVDTGSNEHNKTGNDANTSDTGDKKAELDRDPKTSVREYLIDGVLKEAADEGVLEAGRAAFEKEVPIYSRYIKNAVWNIKKSSLSDPMKKLVYYGLTGLGAGAVGAGAVALKNRADLNKYRKRVAEAFMEDEANDQKKMYDIARRAYQMGLMRAGKEGQ